MNDKTIMIARTIACAQCHCDHETSPRMTGLFWDEACHWSRMTESLWKNLTSLWLGWMVLRRTESLWKTRSHFHQCGLWPIILEWWAGYCDHCDRSWKWQRYSGMIIRYHDQRDWSQNDRIIWNGQNVIMISVTGSIMTESFRKWRPGHCDPCDQS